MQDVAFDALNIAPLEFDIPSSKTQIQEEAPEGQIQLPSTDQVKIVLEIQTAAAVCINSWQTLLVTPSGHW